MPCCEVFGRSLPQCCSAKLNHNSASPSGCDSTRALLGSASPYPFMPLIPALSKPFVRFLSSTKSLSKKVS